MEPTNNINRQANALVVRKPPRGGRLGQRGSGFTEVLVLVGVLGIVGGGSMIAVGDTIYDELNQGRQTTEATSLNGGGPSAANNAAQDPGYLAPTSGGNEFGISSGIKPTGNGTGAMTPIDRDDEEIITVDYGGGIVIVGTREFVDKILADLKKIEGTESGKVILSGIAGSGKTVTIRELDPANNATDKKHGPHASSENGKDAFPEGVQVYPTPFDWVLGDGTGEGTNSEVAVTGDDYAGFKSDTLLFHELSHSNNHTNGTSHKRIGDRDFGPMSNREETMVMEGGWVNERTYNAERERNCGAACGDDYSQSRSAHHSAHSDPIDHTDHSIETRKRRNLKYEIGELERKQSEAAKTVIGGESANGRNKTPRIERAKSVFESTSDQLAEKRRELEQLDGK